MLCISAKGLRSLSGLFSSNLTDQSSRRMGLVLACVVGILHDDWSLRLEENRPGRVLKHLVAMRLLVRLDFLDPLVHKVHCVQASHMRKN